MVSIGDRLREERDALGLSQEEFAAATGITKKTQGLYERNERSPSAKYLAALAEHGVDVLYVLTGQRTMPAADALSEAETQLVEAFRAMPAESQAAMLQLTSSLSSTGKHKLTDKL